MRKILGLAGVAAVLAMVVPLLAAVTVRGEVVDIACATTRGDGGRGEAHTACALSCAKEGQPVGILTDDAIYEVIGDFAADHNARLLDFVAKSVTATGEVTERDGKKLINVRTIRAN